MLRRLSFSLWYFFRPPWDTGISPPELLEFLAQHPAGRAIDLGCGTGTNVITLVRHGWQATGVDFAPRAVRLAQQKLRRAGVQARLQVGDVTKLEGITGPFDLALDLGCFHGIPNKGAYLEQVARVLAPGGHWLLYAIWKSASGDAGPGLLPSDVDLIQSRGFRLLNRTDGWNRRNCPSAWLLLQHSPGSGA